MSQLAELASRIARHAVTDSRPQWIEGILVFSAKQVTAPMGSVTEPMFTLVVRGAKRTILGDHVFEHGAGKAAVVTVELPLIGQIVEAPFLALGIRLEPATIAQLMVDGGPTTIRPHEGPGMAVSDADEKLLDAIVRLMRLLDDPRDLRVLGPAVRREIHWWLLNGPQGPMIRQAGIADSRLALVARAIAWIRTRYDRVIRIDDLASDIGTSVSSLNRHFRAVTAMSPLQYQKQIRLQKARLHLIAAPHDVAAIGYSVGYDNPSQFSREYRRMYGAPPGQDAIRLQTMAIVQE
ncbi:AraC family transcriptional regulator [Kibdelosporangium philippinense]|uniref:AraC family transcriptional regulator n=2 Tax=Kibdelosporangium philippinense TaxID=211113 RepID=A0ABS8ZUT8_9PSEU|nr:AraC family transcriptional regulator [Kibdelosporangium philippinense]MCE7010188.1 AraC family transcriptional regulator [Kibdelosporangium philippinense]